jgi:hypothetical protein
VGVEASFFVAEYELDVPERERRQATKGLSPPTIYVVYPCACTHASKQNSSVCRMYGWMNAAHSLRETPLNLEGERLEHWVPVVG